MGVREQVVRGGLALLVIGIVVALIVRDRVGEDRTATPEPSAPSATGSPDPTGTPSASPSPSAPAEPVPTPPSGIEDLVCEAVAQRPVNLRILSFNTHASVGPAGSLATVAEEIREVRPDIVLLQEVDRFQVRSAAVDQSTHFGDVLDMQGSFSANLVRGNGQYGTLILSRHDIVQQGRFRLPGPAGREPRSLQWVTLDVDGRHVRVYNTHLDPTRPRVRQRQASYVSTILRQETLPVVLGGDLNSWPGTAPVRTLGAGLTDTWSRGRGPAATARGGRKIDYIFVSPDLRPVRSGVAASAVSDHNRLWADVRLRPDRTCPRPSRPEKR